MTEEFDVRAFKTMISSSNLLPFGNIAKNWLKIGRLTGFLF